MVAPYVGFAYNVKNALKNGRKRGLLMDDILWPITQMIVIGAAICNLLSWAAIAFAIRYYAPYPRGEIK
tara:strand:+ start:420 stop:626 length:207 start_codon:yes stop_codon:yes gene_type:complete